MKNKWRRFEVLLPLKLNDGRDVPRALLGRAVNEVIEEFGAVSFESRAVEGRWRHEGIEYRDNLSKIIVDVADTERNRTWMRAFKRRWKKRLAQLELWMVSYPIDVE